MRKPKLTYQRSENGEHVTWCRCLGPQRDSKPDRAILRCVPTIASLFPDGGYAKQKLEAAVAHIDQLTIEITRRSDLTGFVVLPGAG